MRNIDLERRYRAAPQVLYHPGEIPAGDHQPDRQCPRCPARKGRLVVGVRPAHDAARPRRRGCYRRRQRLRHGRGRCSIASSTPSSPPRAKREPDSDSGSPRESSTSTTHDRRSQQAKSRHRLPAFRAVGSNGERKSRRRASSLEKTKPLRASRQAALRCAHGNPIETLCA